AFPLGPQVPDRVDDRAGGHVQDALLGPQPAQLHVLGQRAEEAAHVGRDVLEPLAADVPLQRLHGGHRQLVPPAVREGEAVAFQAQLVRAQDDIGGRVVALVHGVRPVPLARGGEADVAGHDLGDLHYWFTPLARKPPSTARSVPVTKLAPSEARKTAAPCSSSTRPKRRMGVRSRNSWPRGVPSSRAALRSVRKTPGTIAFTQTPWAAHSTASDRVRAATPALLAV